MKKAFLTLLCGLALAGCGYRAPLHQSYIPVVTDSTLYGGVRADFQQLAALMEKDTGMKPIEGNTVSLVFEGQENLDRMLDDVRAAGRSVYIEPYRFCLDSVGTVLAGILREKAASGVDVRIILDKAANTAEDIRKLKTLRDTMPGLEQFFGVPVQVVPEYPTDRRLPTRNCLEWALAYAQKYFWYYNPYSPPPPSTIEALQEAARRGVDVRWIAPSITDIEPERGIAESMYEGLLDAGVRIYEWQDHMMHAKQYLCDDYLTIIGSTNMDNLSLFLNYELLALLYDERICHRAAETFLHDLETHCREITLEEVKSWPEPRKWRNWILRILGGPLA